MQISRVGVVVVAVFAVGWLGGASAQTGRKYIQPRTANATGAPFSGAVLVGDTLYLSGALGLEANQQPPASADAEATNVLNNIQKTLAEAGMTMDDLVFVQVLLLGRLALRRVQQDLSRLLQTGISGARLSRLGQTPVRRPLRSARDSGQEIRHLVIWQFVIWQFRFFKIAKLPDC